MLHRLALRHLAMGLAALATLSGPAQALSCLRPDLARSFHQAAASPHNYIVVRGTLSFDATRLPETRDVNGMPGKKAQTTDLPARITGRFLSQKGFVTGFDRKIILRAICLGPWCGEPKPGVDYLAFLRETPKGYILEVNPCGGMAFTKPSNAILNQAVSCIRGQACTPKPGR